MAYIHGGKPLITTFLLYKSCFEITNLKLQDLQYRSIIFRSQPLKLFDISKQSTTFLLYASCFTMDCITVRVFIIG